MSFGEESRKVTEDAVRVKEVATGSEEAGVEVVKDVQHVIEKQEKIIIPKTITFKHFWKGMLEGKFTPITREEVESLVENIYLDKSVPRMVVLSPEEYRVLKRFLVEKLLIYLNGSRAFHKKFIEGNIALNKEEQGHSIELVDVDSMEDDRRNLTPLTQGEKIAIFSDPKNISRIIFNEGPKYNNGVSYSSGITGYGIRRLDDYCEREYFVAAVDRVKRNTGHQVLNMMDVGGGNGRALHDVRNMYPEMGLTNLTITEEIAMFGDGIKHLLCPAEIMPASLKEAQDIIWSNTSFRYFVFPDKALRCVIESLSVGGEAELGIEIFADYEYNEGKIKQWEEMMCVVRRMVKDGVIRIFDSKEDEDFWEKPHVHRGWMRIVKKKLFNFSDYMD